MRHTPIPPVAAHDPLPDYQPVTLTRQRHDGWTAERQRAFLIALAETGCISEACREAGITARSAYRLRAHRLGKRFAEAWDQALRYSTAKLMTLAYERAIRGTMREHWRGGELVGETKVPSDRLLVYLLDRLTPWGLQPQADTQWARLNAISGAAARDLTPILDRLDDCAVPAEPLCAQDFMAQAPIAADPLLPRFADCD